MDPPNEQAVINPKRELPDASESLTESTVTPSVLDSEDYLCAQKCVFCQCIMTLKDGSKLMECLHPACDSCLRTPSNNSDIDLGEGQYLAKVCPVCQIQSNPAKLIDNKQLVEITALQVNCDTKCKNCVDQIANDWCNECTNYICEACVTEHRSSRLCKHHTIVSKDEMFLKKESNPVIDSYFKCSIHPKESQEMYCNSCGEILCRDCTLVNHKAHSYAYVSEIAATTRAELTALVSKLRYRTDLARETIHQIELKNKMIQDRRVELHHQVRETANEIIGCVKKAAESLMAEIDTECEKKKVTNDAKAKALNQVYIQGNYTHDFVVQALEMSTDKCLAYTRQRIVDHVNRQLLTKNISIASPEYPISMKIKRTFSMDKLKQALGQFIKFESGDSPYVVNIPQSAVNQQTFMQHQQQYQQMQKQQQAWYNSQQQQQQQPQATASMYQQPYQQSVVHHQPPMMVPQQPHVNVIQGSSSGPLRSPQQQVSSSTDQQATSPLHSPHGRLPQHQSMGYGGGMPSGMGTSAKPGAQQQFWMQQQQYHAAAASGQQPVPPPQGNSPHLKNILTQQPQQQASMHHQQQGMARMSMQQQQQVARQQVVGRMNSSVVQQSMQQSHSAIRLHPHQQQGPSPSSVTSTPALYAKSWHIPQMAPEAGSSSTSMPAARSQHYPVAGSSGSSSSSLGGQSQDNFKIHLPSRVDPPKPLATVTGVLREPTHPPTPDIDSLCRDETLKEIASMGMIDSGNSLAGFSGNKDDTANKDISQGDKTVTSTAATPPASAVPSATPEQPSTSTQQEVGVVEWQKDDPNEDWCAVCMDGGDLVCCDSCPKVFHTTCHIPQLAQTPPQDEPWQCLLCRTLPCVSGIGDKRSQDLTVTQHTILERILLELYCQYDQSLHFREPVPPENKEYHNIIKKPMSFDMIRRRLAPDSYNPYKSVRQVIRHIRQVFKNAFLFNEVGSQVFKDAINLEEFLECLLTKYLPDFAHTDLSDSSSDEDDEPQVKRFRRIIGGSEG